MAAAPIVLQVADGVGFKEGRGAKPEPGEGRDR
jgi:hypothetical protein